MSTHTAFYIAIKSSIISIKALFFFERIDEVSKLEVRNGVSLITFDLLSKYGIKHCFSTRLGGVSSKQFESMNLGFGRGDSEENVLENYRRIAAALGVNIERMCLSQQTHTTNVRIMTGEDAGNGIVRKLPYSDVDGMITDEKGMTLVTFYADCVPLFFYDPVRKVIGLSHSGWRGTVGKIGAETVRKMVESYGSRPEDIIACVGPSICGKCYEVSGDVADRFAAAFDRAKEKGIIGPSLFNPDNHDKYMLDLWKANKLVFLEAGIREENIEITEYCTHCNPDLFYSHRTMGADRGSLAAFMCL